MKLYYSPLSANSRKVRVAAALLGIELELELVDLRKLEQRQPEYLAKNPMGKVPLLVDGDLVLPESAAIMMYLAESKPGNTLYPAERRARAEVHRWMFWGAAHFTPALVALMFETVIKKRLALGDPEPLQVQRQQGHIRELGQVLDAHLATRSWVAGPDPTVADLAIAVGFMTALPAGAPLQPFAHVMAWYERIQALDAWKSTEATAP